MTVALEGWGPFRALPSRRAETVIPAAGTTSDDRLYLGAVTPWRRLDAIVCSVVALVGAAGVGVCWNGASREAAFRDQIGWTVGSFLFLALFVLGGVLWLMVGFRRVRHGIHELHADANMVFHLEELDVLGATEAEPTGLDLVVGPGMQRAHRPDCMLVRGKRVNVLTPSQRAEFPPCGMCMS